MLSEAKHLWFWVEAPPKKRSEILLPRLRDQNDKAGLSATPNNIRLEARAII